MPSFSSLNTIFLKAKSSFFLGLKSKNDTISEKEIEIENHKKEIANLEKEISECNAEMMFSKNNINAEVDRIAELIKFVEGGNT